MAASLPKPDLCGPDLKVASARLHGLPHEALTGAEVNSRWPGYRLPASHRAVFQPEGGFVLSERAIVAHAGTAMTAGADLRARERVLAWEARPSGEGVIVTTDKDRHEAGRLVLAPGAWMADLATGDGATQHDISFLRVRRFGRRPGQERASAAPHAR